MKYNVPSAVRIALCVVLLVIAYVLQTTLGLRIAVFGAHIDLLPLIVAAAALQMGPAAGMVCGLAAGILYDTTGLGAEGLYPLYYMICGIACGLVRGRLCRMERRGTMLCAVGMIALLAALRYLFYFQFGDISLLTFLRNVIVQAALAAVFSVPVLAVVRRIAGRKPQISVSPDA